MPKAIKYHLTLFLFLYLLLVSSIQISFAQSSNHESQDSLTPKIIKIEIFNPSHEKWQDQTNFFRQNESLIFNESSSNLKITLEKIDPVYSNQIQYSYRLGSANPWTQLENNVVEIQNIRHGKSTLQIRKRKSNGHWSSSQIEIKIYRQQPFYFRFPFLIGVFLSVIALIILYRKWLPKQKNQQASNTKNTSLTTKETSSSPPVENVEQPLISKLPKAEDTNIEILSNEWEKLVHKNANSLIEDRKFSIIELAATMNLSERQFRRKLKQKTGLRPADYMREIRLLKAKDFLKNKTYPTVAEVCFAVGFSTPKHFSKIFKERFGEKPSFYLGKRKTP